MNEIKATFRIVTPMFLGGANTSELADTIRPPSIKGAMRFWWRALTWGRIRAQASDDNAALSELHRQEADLFGLAAGANAGGQSRLSLNVRDFKRLGDGEIVSNWPLRNTGSGYLGLGLFESGHRDKGTYQAARKAFPEDRTFTLALRFRPNTRQEQIEELRETLHVFGLLGGLGSRGQRRGFGSVALTKLDGQDTSIASKEAYRSAVERVFVSAVSAPVPPYTALSQDSSFKLFPQTHSKARSAHNALGDAYKQHRGQASNLRGRAKIGFGLPLMDVDTNNRRASPLHFHVHPVGNEFVGVVLYLPSSLFHPAYEHPDMQPVAAFVK